LLEIGLKPDLVFSDVIMPGKINGIELAEIIVARLPGVPVLLSSGFTERAIIEAQARDNRPLNFAMISKPYRKNELALAIQEALRGPST